jgi:ABC-2 type transport system ATP-binding protein
MTDAVIETRGLRKQFGDKLAVADLSLTVGRGEVFGFLGPNGAGKTTSLKMLLGLIEPTAGQAWVLGRPLGDRRGRSRVGFLPEHFRFHDWLTGRELLDFHARLYGMDKPYRTVRIEELLERVDLTDAGDRRVRDYSKGMLQRIGLAQALLNQPELVFLDEPTSGLDPIGRLLVRDIIADLRRGGTSVFLNSHLLGEVEATCDRVVFIKQGRTVREMTLAEHPAGIEVELRIDPVTPELLEGLSRFAEDVRRPTAVAAPSAPSGAELLDGWVHLRVTDEDALPELARWLVGQQARLYQLRSHRPSLEKLFLEVMGEDQRPG